jgi:hypothetical protein
MDQELKNKLETIEQKIDKIDKYINTIKKVFLWSFILTLAFIIIPLLGMLWAIPKFLSSIDMSGYSQLLGI